MTDKEHKDWIDGASYRQLLSKWRFEPSGSPWFSGEVGEYFSAAMVLKQQETPHGEQVAASKNIGWKP